MTVGELRDYLSHFPDDYTVIVSDNQIDILAPGSVSAGQAIDTREDGLMETWPVDEESDG